MKGWHIYEGIKDGEKEKKGSFNEIKCEERNESSTQASLTQRDLIK